MAFSLKSQFIKSLGVAGHRGLVLAPHLNHKKSKSSYSHQLSKSVDEHQQGCQDRMVG